MLGSGTIIQLYIKGLFFEQFLKNNPSPRADSINWTCSISKQRKHFAVLSKDTEKRPQ